MGHGKTHLGILPATCFCVRVCFPRSRALARVTDWLRWLRRAQCLHASLHRILATVDAFFQNTLFSAWPCLQYVCFVPNLWVDVSFGAPSAFVILSLQSTQQSRHQRHTHTHQVTVALTVHIEPPASNTYHVALGLWGPINQIFMSRTRRARLGPAS